MKTKRNRKKKKAPYLTVQGVKTRGTKLCKFFDGEFFHRMDTFGLTRNVKSDLQFIIEFQEKIDDHFRMVYREAFCGGFFSGARYANQKLKGMKIE